MRTTVDWFLIICFCTIFGALSNKLIGFIAIALIVSFCLFAAFRKAKCKIYHLAICIGLVAIAVVAPIDIKVSHAERFRIKLLPAIEGHALFAESQARLNRGEKKDLDYVVLRRQAFLTKTRYAIVISIPLGNEATKADGMP